MMRNLLDQGAYLPSLSCAIGCSPHLVYTAASQDLGILYQPMVANCSQAQYGSLMNMPKYGILSEEPPQGKNEVQYDQ